MVTASAAAERALYKASQISSLPLSHSQTHMQIMWVNETSTRHRAEMWTKPGRCQLLLVQVALQSLQSQNICFFSLTASRLLGFGLVCFWSYILNLLIARSWRRFTGFSSEYSLALQIKENSYLWAERQKQCCVSQPDGIFDLLWSPITRIPFMPTHTAHLALFDLMTGQGRANSSWKPDGSVPIYWLSGQIS